MDFPARQHLRRFFTAALRALDGDSTEIPSSDRPGPAGPSVTVASVVGVLMAVGFIAFLRRPDIIVRPQFWAEDGMLFTDAREQGWNVLFSPYPAYFIVAQRFVTCAVAHLPVLWQPVCFCYSAFALMLLTAWFCLRARLDYLMDFRGRVAMAFAVVLVPHSGEVFLVLINTQWTLAPILLILIIQEHTRRFGEAVIDFLGLLIAGMTGPFIVLYAPWFLLRFRRVTGGFSAYNIALVAVAWTLVLAQILMMRTGPLPPCQYSSEVHKWLKTMAFWLPGGLFFGESVPLYLGRMFWLITPALLGLLGWALWRTERKRFWAALALCGAAAATYLGGFSSASPADVDSLSTFDFGGRYFYPTYVFFIWMGIIFYHDVSSRLRLAAKIALVMIFFAGASHFTIAPLENYHWANFARKVDAGESQKDVPFPPGWTMDIPAR